MVEESYAIDADQFRDTASGAPASFVTYIVRLSATFDQNLDFKGRAPARPLFAACNPVRAHVCT